MNDHEGIRAKLPLAAAGVLARSELSTVEQHAATCLECRRELEALRLYARGLRELPQPLAPPGLLQATRARILQEQAAAAERRWQDLMLGLLTLFSWGIGVVYWMLFRALTGGLWRVFGANLADAVTWYWVWALLVWTTAGVAVVMLGQRTEWMRRAL
jgi:hypothetical protein